MAGVDAAAVLVEIRAVKALSDGKADFGNTTLPGSWVLTFLNVFIAFSGPASAIRYTIKPDKSLELQTSPSPCLQLKPRGGSPNRGSAAGGFEKQERTDQAAGEISVTASDPFITKRELWCPRLYLCLEPPDSSDAPYAVKEKIKIPTSPEETCPSRLRFCSGSGGGSSCEASSFVM